MALPLIIGASGSSSAPPFISSASALIRPFPTKGTSPASSPLIRPFPSKPGPQWPDWINISSPGFGSKLTSAGLLNERQRPIEDALRTVAGDTRKMGPVYGPTTLGGRVDIIEQIGTYLYIRALLCLGEIEQISSIKINDTSYLTGDPTSDPDYKGDWEDSATWTALGGLPYSASVGEIFLYGSAYYECTTAVSITAYTGSYNPTSVYAAYFAQLITSTSVNTYTGTTTQTADPLLAAAGGALTT